MDTNITWHTASVSKDERRVKNGHHSFVIWFTGLSASQIYSSECGRP